MNYNVYVINLARAENRLSTMQKKLTALNLSFERIDAVDGRLMPESDRKEFAAIRPRKNGWTPGAIGCFSSHYEAWKRISNSDKAFGVVFEDDIHISMGLVTLLANISAHLGEIDVLRLEGTKHRMALNKNKIVSMQKCSIVQVTSESWGAGAYVISRRVAQKLVAASKKDHQPTDIYLFDKNTSSIARELNIYQAVPAMCVQSKFDIAMGTSGVIHGSDIEHNSEGKGFSLQYRRLKWKFNGLKNYLLGYRRIALANDIVRL